MNRSEVLARGLRLTGTSQTALSRYTGVPQSKISRYVNGRLEPSQAVLRKLLDALGLTETVDVHPVELERTKQRSWALHRELAGLLRPSMDVAWWTRVALNLERVRENTQGQPHEANIVRWQEIVATRDLSRLRHVLIDVSQDGVDMREVSPMSGLLSQSDRARVLEGMSR